MADGAAGGSARSQPAGAGWVDTALPLDDVDSTDIDLAGRLAELVERLRVVTVRLSGPQPLAEWIAALTATVESLTATGPADLWQAIQLRSELTSTLEAAGARADKVPLTLAELRQLLAERLAGRPTRANFRTGSLTMCTLVPMRSVPHRVVCLLGLDDGAFPRRRAADGDDVLRRDPITGERDERSEDRQLLLDALLSAEERLIVTYSGNDERTNIRRPPAVPVGELLDALDDAFVRSDGIGAREALVLRHPLQPFDPSNFRAQPGDRAFSFDTAALEGARAMCAPRVPAPVFLAAPLPPAPPEALELDTLRRFLEGPVRGFLRQRLDVTLPQRDEETSDALPLELNGLERWGVGQRMVDARLAGIDADTARQAEWRRGALPPRALGVRVLNDIAGDVEDVVRAAADVQDGEPRVLDLSVVLPSGRRLTGTVGGLFGTTLVTVSFGRINPKRRLRAWLPYLLLAAALPAQRFSAVAVGGRSRCALGPMAPEEALAWLADLLDLHACGLREPLPMAVATSFEYALMRRQGAAPEPALARAGGAWRGKWGEFREPEHEQVFGRDAPLRVLTAAAPEPGDRPEGWADEPSRFGVLARRWWDPLLTAEARSRP